MTDFKPAYTEINFIVIANLANKIRREHYISIVGKPQIDYMLKEFQSASAIHKHIGEGFEYFIIIYNQEAVGYLSVRPEKEALFLSKIYVLSEYRGKGIGKRAMEFIDDRAGYHNLKTIYLTVNKNNSNSIKAYERMGFENLGSVVKDIGNGFVMDDYKMKKILI